MIAMGPIEDIVIVGVSGATVRLVPVPPDGKSQRELKPVGHALDRYIGTWSDEEATQVLEAVELFEQIDPAFWK